MIFELKPKPIGITKEQVWSAWKRIKIVSNVVCSLGIWLVTIKVVMKSRMMGDYHVRFRERLGLKCPGLLDDTLTI